VILIISKIIYHSLYQWDSAVEKDTVMKTPEKGQQSVRREADNATILLIGIGSKTKGRIGTEMSAKPITPQTNFKKERKTLTKMWSKWTASKLVPFWYAFFTPLTRKMHLMPILLCLKLKYFCIFGTFFFDLGWTAHCARLLNYWELIYLRLEPNKDSSFGECIRNRANLSCQNSSWEL